MQAHAGIWGSEANPENPAVWEAHKKAMQKYLGLKRFYAQGVFYGLDETVHVHTLADLKESVINVFNVDDKPVEKEIKFRLAEIGLANTPVQIDGAAFDQNGDEITLKVTVPARGHVLCEVRGK